MRLDQVGTRVAERIVATSGTEWTYSRGSQSEAISFLKTEQPPLTIENSTSVTEIIIASFRCLTSALVDFGKPKSGDKLTNGTLTFEVRPIVDKCYYTVGGMTHIHTQQVAN